MEVELIWRRPNAPSVALRGGLRLLRLAEFVRYNDITEQLLAGHRSGSQWTHSYQAASAQLGFAQTPKVIKLM